MVDPLWSGTCWSTFKYFIILIVSTYYILCIRWIIKCFSRYWPNSCFYLNFPGDTEEWEETLCQELWPGLELFTSRQTSGKKCCRLSEAWYVRFLFVRVFERGIVFYRIPRLIITQTGCLRNARFRFSHLLQLICVQEVCSWYLSWSISRRDGLE